MPKGASTIIHTKSSMTTIILHDVNRSSLVLLCLGFPNPLYAIHFFLTSKLTSRFSKTAVAQSLSVNIPHFGLRKKLIKRSQKINHNFL